MGFAGTSVDTSTLCAGVLCDFTVDATELQNMTAANLIVGPQSISGSVTSGDIFLERLTASDTAGISGETILRAFHISGSNGTITFNGNSTLAGLDVGAVNGIVVNGNLTTSSGDMILNGDTDNFFDINSLDINGVTLASGFSLTSAGDLILSGRTNGITSAGAVALSAANEMILHDSLSATGSATLNAGTGISHSHFNEHIS